LKTWTAFASRDQAGEKNVFLPVERKPVAVIYMRLSRLKSTTVPGCFPEQEKRPEWFLLRRTGTIGHICFVKKYQEKTILTANQLGR
jgi:hypothetical protein